MIRMSVGQANKLGIKSGKKKSKYRNEVTYDAAGNKFDSKMEAEYHQHLLLLQWSGEIKDLRLQPKYELEPKRPGVRAINYVADFEYVVVESGQRVAVDVKGAVTQAFAMKRKLFAARYPDILLKVITKRGGRWVDLDEAKKTERKRNKALKALGKRARR